MKRFFAIIFTVIVLVGSITGCGKDTKSNTETPNQEKTIGDEEKSIPESYMITAKNYFDYQSGLECSAFSSAYVLRHYGEEADGVELFKTFPEKISGGGVSPDGIEKFFNKRGYEAEYKCNGTIENLKEQLSKGTPVIVFIHVSEPYTSTHNTHYVPLVGYDNEYFYFAESLSYLANCKDEKDVSYNRKTEISKFKRLWDNIDGVWDYPYFTISKKS